MVEREVRWSEGAQCDLADVVDYIAGDGTRNALRVFERLHRQARRLEHFAERGRRIPELAGSADKSKQPWREIVLRPWRMIYSVEDGVVLVIAIVDCRRDFVAWLARRLGDELPPSSP